MSGKILQGMARICETGVVAVAVYSVVAVAVAVLCSPSVQPEQQPERIKAFVEQLGQKQLFLIGWAGRMGDNSGRG